MTVEELTIQGPPEEPPPPDEPRRWSPRRRWVAVLGTIVVVGLVTAALLVKLPYYTLSPGSARATEPLISVEGAPTYESDGNIDFLTVSLRHATPIDLLAAWINPAVDVKSEEELFPNQTPEENRQLNLQAMSQSKDAATYQALTRLGYDIPASGSGALVAAPVEEGTPACGVLGVGDVITSVDGTPVALASDLIETLAPVAPGTEVSMEVTTLDLPAIAQSDASAETQCPVDEREPGGSRTVDVALGARPEDPSRAYLGIALQTNGLSFDFPVDVTIDSGRVGGPSAGLAFTLGLLDVMTPGSLTGGLSIATTGTMELDGRVGPIGGIAQKVEAAKREGVQLMLVPSSEIDEARRHADGLRVEPVEDLDDALAVLATVGGGDAVLPAEPASAQLP
ncbi:MAG TPA: S16 family serine protease [Acidimicrobiales bacterium]